MSALGRRRGPGRHGIAELLQRSTHILAFGGDSKVVWFEGNYADYELDLKRRKGADANEPRRIRYRKLSDG
jgi:hypothetical protein